MSKKTLTRLWMVTGLVALFLVVATILVATRAKHAGMRDERVFVTSSDGWISVYEQPDRESTVVVTLANGSSVLIVDYTISRGRTWFLVSRSGAEPGWVLARDISLERD